MTDLFKTKLEAKAFLIDKTKDFIEIETEIVAVISDAVISQEHHSYFDFTLDIRHTASILEVQDGYKVEVRSKKYSALVLAAETGDLELFKKELQKPQSVEAISLAFVSAIQNERLNILHYYYISDYINKISLYKDPIITAIERDKINSLQFFVRKGLKLPDETLSYIFHNNSMSALNYLFKDAILSTEILEDKFKTCWALRLLNKKDNESIQMFKKHLNYR